MKKTIENNKLIAEFMGLGYDIEGRVSFMYSIGEEFPLSQRFCEESLIEDEVQKEIEEANPYDFMVETYSFHTSWDWLMPVIKKIRETINTKLDFSDFDKMRHYEHKLNPYDYDINQVYESIIEFIKWYNENKIS